MLTKGDNHLKNLHKIYLTIHSKIHYYILPLIIAISVLLQLQALFTIIVTQLQIAKLLPTKKVPSESGNLKYC